jgi:hypothetical protein
MSTKELVLNPKQVGSNTFDCRPQVGKCPIDCNQCFYNRPGAFYCDIDEPYIPDPELVGDSIVRMNCGHDSNIERAKVIEAAQKYPHHFYNTSIPKLDFPGPVVLTSNPKEEEGPGYLPRKEPYCDSDLSTPVYKNLMFVRLRVSSSNIDHIDTAAEAWWAVSVPVVMTFMAYYEEEARPSTVEPDLELDLDDCYEWKVRHINSYWCPTRPFIEAVMRRYRQYRLHSLCGMLDSVFCRDCRNCETYYWQTLKRLQGA